jgi:hypothetical protein
MAKASKTKTEAGNTKPAGSESKQAPSDSKQANSTVNPATHAAQAALGAANDPITMLKNDHRKVEAMFAEYGSADEARKQELIRQVCEELVIHTMLEEEIFYPECRRKAANEDPLDDAQVEHDSAKILIAELLEGSDDEDEYRDAKFRVLAEQIRHHVAEEEKPQEGIFAKAQSAGVVTGDLARRLRERKTELQQGRAVEQGQLRAVSFIHQTGFPSRSMEDRGMARQPERDERGRFMSDDDDDRRYRSRRRDDDDDRGRGRGGWFGDSEGHSQAARERWGERGPSSRYRDDDDDDRRSRGRRDDDDDDRGRGRGGWFGDSEGHSRAARERWDERPSTSRHREDDDDDRRRARSRDDDDDDRGRGRGGWFGDPEGHSRAARERWGERGPSSRYRDEEDDDDRRYRSRGRDDDDDGRGHGRGGWFGDPEGHSEAARSRGGGRRGSTRDDDDDRRARSRGRDDDDGRGWHGDPRGHAAAARKGWENRR